MDKDESYFDDVKRSNSFVNFGVGRLIGIRTEYALYTLSVIMSKRNFKSQQTFACIIIIFIKQTIFD